jgi:hypothetical protein
MAVTTFHDFPLASRDREWDGAAAEKRVRAWADAERPRPPGRRAPGDHGGRQHHARLPRGIDLPESDITRVKSHLAKYYKKMGETASWERN